MSDTTIASLGLEISSNSQNAVSGLDALATSLNKLKTATKGGLGLQAVATQLQSIKGATDGISSNIQSISGLATAIRLLNGVKISSTLGKNISSLSTALGTLDVGSGQAKIQELVGALTPLSTMPQQNISSTLNQIKRMPEVFKALESVDTSSVREKILDLADALKPLGDEMQKVANGFSAFPNKLQKLVSQTNNLATSNGRAKSSYTDVYSSMRMVTSAITTMYNVISGAIKKSNDYIENINLFTVSMGDYAKEASDYAKTVSDAMGISDSDWMRNQGVFMTLGKGFGVVEERANMMSKNLTQLGYDISSFFNISVEDAMQKLQSGYAGELEPLRRLGYDLSQAKLETIALSLGIDKSVESMTQAEKAQLRYYAIMTQVTDSHGDMARTLDAPANQLRVLTAQFEMLGREVGNIFQPILKNVLPNLIAMVKVLREVASVIAKLVGYEPPDLGEDESNSVTESTESIVENMDASTESAEGLNEELKKIKSTMLGFDELNIVSQNDTTSDNEDIFAGIDLPEYDFLANLVENKVNEIVDKMKEWLGVTDDIGSWVELLDTNFGNILKNVGLIAVGLLTWKISEGFSKVIDTLSNLSQEQVVNISFKLTGLAMLMSDLDKLKQYFEDYLENGATFSNVTGMISEFAGSLGDALIILGNVQVGGALKVAQGLGEIASAINSISENGADFTNVTDLIRGLSNVAIGLGFLTQNTTLTGAGLIIQGLTTVIQELSENWEAIKQGDWSGVDKVTMIVGVITALGGVVTALDVFSKLKKSKNLTDTIESVNEVTTVTESVSTSTSNLTSKLTSLAKDLALGLVIIAEIATATLLIVGTILVLGLALEQVGIAWTPVIENAGTVAIAMGVGTGLLVAIGVASALLGSVGTPLIVNIALGTAILLELGVASALFLTEILVVGKLLSEIGEAWKPVLKNGDTIATGIGIGTGLLVAIGVVAGALGVATVATAGLLPLAIGLGTLMLVELGVAFIAFTDEIIKVADQLAYKLAPSLDKVNLILPDLSTDMGQFVSFMQTFAGYVVSFTASTTISGIASTIGKFISFFTTDPIQSMNDEISTQHTRMVALIDTLKGIMPVIQEATGLAKDYNKFMDEFSTATGTSNGIGSSTIWGTLANDIATAWDSISKKTKEVWDKVKDKFQTTWSAITNFVKDPINSIISGIESLANGVIKGINGLINALNRIHINVPDWVTALTGLTDFGFNISTIATISIPRFAQGGYPESGEAFIARENGIPEMVGRIGNRTAVANNDQIVESVAMGVADANSEQNALLREQNALLREILAKDNGVYLDGRSLSESVDKYKRSNGRVIIAGGVL